MGSLSDTPTVNLLEYLRSKSRLDVDSLDIKVSTTRAPFVDCTSNQAEGYTELLNPERASLLNRSLVLARNILPEYPNLTFEELAFEISMVNLALTIAPNISGSILVMTNPRYAGSVIKTVENAQRFVDFCHILDPGFDKSRLCLKVPATWEGLQACRKLTGRGIKTAATTLFTKEQAILAAEAGCECIIPFIHELKVLFDKNFHGAPPIFNLCLHAQQYFAHHAYPTHVKAAALLTVDDAIRLSGITAVTLEPHLLEALAAAHEPEAALAQRSIFSSSVNDKSNGDGWEEKVSYIDNEAGFRAAMRRGHGDRQTVQALNIFSDFQAKAEAMMRDADQLSLFPGAAPLKPVDTKKIDFSRNDHQSPNQPSQPPVLVPESPVENGTVENKAKENGGLAEVSPEMNGTGIHGQASGSSIVV